MKDKILSALKTKYKNIGFRDQAFDGVADFLSKTVTKDEDVESAVSGAESLLKVFQGEADYRASKLQKELDELKAKEQVKPEPPKPDDELPAWFKEHEKKTAERIQALEQENAAFKTEKSKAERQSNIISKAKALNISKERIEQGFVIAEDADDTAIDKYLASVASYEVKNRAESKHDGLFLKATKDDDQKQLAADFVSQLPDA